MDISDLYEISQGEPIPEYLTKSPLRRFMAKILKAATPSKNILSIQRDIRVLIQQLAFLNLREIYYEIYHSDLTLLTHVVSSIVQVCIKKVLNQWTGYNSEMDHETMYNDLKNYLKQNIDAVLANVDEFLDDCEKKKDRENVQMEVFCDYKKLKSLIYYDVHPKSGSIVNYNKVEYKINDTFYDEFSKYLLNAMFVQIKIVHPDFEIKKENEPLTKYKLCKLHCTSEPKLKAYSTRLRYKRIDGNHQQFSSKHLLQFFQQLKQAVRLNTSFTVGKKIDMLAMCNEFEEDLRKIKHNFDTNTEYYCFKSKYPYFRYLGQNLGEPLGAPKVDFSAQTAQEDNSLNMRLLESMRPLNMFVMYKFNLPSIKNEDGSASFSIPDQMVNFIMNRCIFYKCTLCNLEKVGFVGRADMIHHLLEQHGTEPNWYCFACKREFTTKNLALERWHHDCGSKKK